MSLREGFKRTERIPTKNVCVDRGRAVQKVGKISAFAFEHREEAEFERKFKIAGELVRVHGGSTGIAKYDLS